MCVTCLILVKSLCSYSIQCELIIISKTIKCGIKSKRRPVSIERNQISVIGFNIIIHSIEFECESEIGSEILAITLYIIIDIMAIDQIEISSQSCRYRTASTITIKGLLISSLVSKCKGDEILITSRRIQEALTECRAPLEHADIICERCHLQIISAGFEILPEFSLDISTTNSHLNCCGILWKKIKACISDTAREICWGEAPDELWMLIKPINKETPI